MYPGMQSRARPNLPQVPSMLTASDVLYALGTQRAWSDRDYAYAIVNSYVAHKQIRGKTKLDIHYKLEALEVQVPPHYARAFVDVRHNYGLRGSDVFRLVARASTSASTSRPSSARLSSSTTSLPNRTSTMTAASSRPARPAVERPPIVRPADGESDEPPPPPYAAEDPDPASTRILQEQLSVAAANAAGRGSSDVERPSIDGDSIRANEAISSPVQRVDTRTSTNSAAPSSAPASTPATNNQEEVTEDERRAREASELEEAMRRSRIAEKERLEYEAAIQASLASVEEDTFRRSLQNETDSPGAGPGPSSVRTGVYTPSPLGPSPVPSPGPAEQMPGAFHSNINKAHPPLPQDNALDEMFGGIDLNAPTLQPTPASPPGKGKQRASDDLSKRFQSNNPFLTAEERERQQQEEMDAHAGPVQHSQHSPALHDPHDVSTPPALPARPGGWSTPGHEAGAVVLSSSPRAPDRALPPPLGEEHYGTQHMQYHTGAPHPQYSSPSGPPPTWQQHPSPSGPPPGWHGAPSPPALTLTAPSRNGTVDAGWNPAAEERASRPLPRPTGPPKAMPGPAAVNHMRQVSGGIPMEAEELDADSDSSSEWGNTPDQSPEISVTVPTTARAPSPAFLDAGGENALEMLAEYDTVFLIDDSSSMAGPRWEQAQKAVMGVVQQAVRYSRNGIDCFFMNSKRVGKDLRVPADVEDLFAGLQPRGATPTGLRIEAILREYMSRLERSVATGDEEVPSMNLIVVTDGAFARPLVGRLRSLAADPSLDRTLLMDSAPTDDPESVLVSIAKRLDRGDFPLSQVGVQLLQIGDDADAREALQELDDGLAAAHGVRDMVDTVPYRGEELTSDLIVKVLLGGINRRLDRRG
ncbi:unnamed protein product [Cutaneotrichosporon oleaginosum]